MTVYKARAKFEKRNPKFKIFYADGSVYKDKTGPPEKAPKQGVVAINGEGYSLSGSEVYCWNGLAWIGLNKDGMIQYFLLPGYKLIMFGVPPDVDTKSILVRAKADNYIKGS